MHLGGPSNEAQWDRPSLLFTSKYICTRINSTFASVPPLGSAQTIDELVLKDAKKREL